MSSATRKCLLVTWHNTYIALQFWWYEFEVTDLILGDNLMFATLHKTLSWFRHNHSVKFYITLTCKTWAVSDSVTCDTHKDVTRLIHGHLNLIKILRKFSKWKQNFELWFQSEFQGPSDLIWSPIFYWFTEKLTLTMLTFQVFGPGNVS